MNKETIKRAKITVIALCLVILVLFIIRLYITQPLSTDGIALGKINDMIDQVRADNSQLQNEILSDESFSVIATKAAQMGFTTNTHIYLLK